MILKKERVEGGDFCAIKVVQWHWNSTGYQKLFQQTGVNIWQLCAKILFYNGFKYFCNNFEYYLQVLKLSARIHVDVFLEVFRYKYRSLLRLVTNYVIAAILYLIWSVHFNFFGVFPKGFLVFSREMEREHRKWVQLELDLTQIIIKNIFCIFLYYNKHFKV